MKKITVKLNRTPYPYALSHPTNPRESTQMKKVLIALIAALSLVSFSASADWTAPSKGPFTNTGTANDSEQS
jgi:hypothetical protein